MPPTTDLPSSPVASTASPTLGAHWDGKGTSFAVFSQHATAIQLCLFDPTHSNHEASTHELVRGPNDIWQAYVPGVGPGHRYGFRASGPYAPSDGHRFNPAKLLLDPYAHAIAGSLTRSDILLGYDPSNPDGSSPDPRDSASFVPRSVVIDPRFDWEGDRPPSVPWNETVVYECHVKGTTQRHPKVDPTQRGQYLGLCSEPIVAHLKRLGITTVELLPIQHSITELRLARAGLTNYWGYNTIGFFAPDARFATADAGAQVVEFKRMVKALHRGGLEVILDVVYNHTAETDHLGPTLCHRGLDNRTYYQLDPADLRRDLNFTGCGNTLNVPNAVCMGMILDSLRYWVRDMHVDGFRLDLASALTRNGTSDRPDMSLFNAIQTDPLLRTVKWIVEPWDAAPGGYLLGQFPRGFVEWNDRYRDTARRFWRGDEGQLAPLATRLAGSSDLFSSERGPQASLNFIISHDGFTLHDLVSYADRHNEANLEQNRDGTHDNASTNGGIEGPTADASILAKRNRLQRSLLATLAFSQGVPMLTAGDELARTQKGNNNAYCQDNEHSWLDWSAADESLIHFTARVFELRRRFPQLRRVNFFSGQAYLEVKDITWLRPDGVELTDADWSNPHARAFAARLVDSDRSEQLLLLFNASHERCEFILPEPITASPWQVLLDSSNDDVTGVAAPRLTLMPHSLRLLASSEVKSPEGAQ